MRIAPAGAGKKASSRRNGGNHAAAQGAHYDCNSRQGNPAFIRTASDLRLGQTTQAKIAIPLFDNLGFGVVKPFAGAHQL
jgi:hypothetical protein